MSRFTIVQAGPEHISFVLDSFTRSLRESMPYSWVPRPILVDDFRRRSCGVDAVTVVAHVNGEPALWMGWLAAIPSRNEVIFCSTKYAFRREPALRVATTLAESVGIDFSEVVRVRYWTRAAERIAQLPGYRLVAAVIEPMELNGGRVT